MSDPATTTAAAPARGIRKTVIGEVVSDKMDKTVVVRTVSRVPHPRFGKIIKQSVKFHAHDEKNEAKIGDKVRVMETRPLSKMKRWRLVEILKH
jgi:small subunit ribosomal protein S17